MTKTELLKLKKKIDAILNKATEEALSEGVNITSTEFEEVLLQLKTKLLEERGITLEEYTQAMTEINEEKRQTKKAKETKDSELISKISMVKGEKGEDGYTPIKGKDYFTEQEINKIKKEITPIKGKDYYDGKTPDISHLEKIIKNVEEKNNEPIEIELEII